MEQGLLTNFFSNKTQKSLTMPNWRSRVDPNFKNLYFKSSPPKTLRNCFAFLERNLFKWYVTKENIFAKYPALASKYFCEEEPLTDGQPLRGLSSLYYYIDNWQSDLLGGSPVCVKFQTSSLKVVLMTGGQRDTHHDLQKSRRFFYFDRRIW
jgi:hypothetical protein